jgi:hypothetical protein
LGQGSEGFPLWAILSGFDPGNVPGVGTFYDFMKRPWLADVPNRLNKVRRYRRRKPKKGKRKGEKSPYKPGIVNRLVERFLKHLPGTTINQSLITLSDDEATILNYYVKLLFNLFRYSDK